MVAEHEITGATPGQPSQPDQPSQPIGRRPFLGMVGLGAAAAVTGPLRPQPAARVPVRIGNFAKEIALASFDQQSGELTATGSAPGVDSPSFLIWSPDRKIVYTVSDSDTGQAAAFAVGADGGLSLLGAQSSEGVMATHLCVHPSGRHLLAVNYGSGSTAVFPIKPDGTLDKLSDLAEYSGSGPDPRQEGPHAHMVVVDPGGKYLLVPDLGMDVVHVHTLDTDTGKLAAVRDVKVRPGAGPRHLAFHPTRSVLYLISELDSTVTVFQYEADSGMLTPGQVLPTSPKDKTENYPAEVVVSKDGRFLYVSNRGHNTTGVFAVSDDGLTLRQIADVPCGGNWPRHIVIDAAGQTMFVSNQYSNTVTTFRVDPKSGGLTALGKPFSTPSPVCVLLP